LGGGHGQGGPCLQLIGATKLPSLPCLCDRQVEFEERQETTSHDAPASSPAERAWQKLQFASLEVDLYRQFLFDEESVGMDMDIMAESPVEQGKPTAQPFQNSTATSTTSSDLFL
jgi:hypothetical protein